MTPYTKITIAGIEMTFYCVDGFGKLRFYYEVDGITIYYIIEKESVVYYKTEE